MSVAAFDTPVLIDALQGHPEAGAELQRYRQRFISRITWIEVMSQAQPDDAQRAEGFLSHFSVVEVSEEIARSAAQLRGQRARRRHAEARRAPCRSRSASRCAPCARAPAAPAARMARQAWRPAR